MGLGTPAYRRRNVRGARRWAQKSGEKRGLINPLKFEGAADDLNFKAPKESRAWMYTQIQEFEEQKKAS